MVKCRKCKKKIENLEYIVTIQDGGIFDLKDEYDSEYLTPEVISSKFFCPRCRKLLFEVEEEAREFLEGGADANICKQKEL